MFVCFMTRLSNILFVECVIFRGLTQDALHVIPTPYSHAGGLHGPQIFLCVAPLHFWIHRLSGRHGPKIFVFLMCLHHLRADTSTENTNS